MTKSYMSGLNPVQTSNVHELISAFTNRGITNAFTKAAMLAIASKECEFTLKAEVSYKNTSNERIRSIFGHHFDGVTEDQLTAMKANDEAFFNKVYGGMYGNKPDEGYKYRGRGFNEITFKGNYAMLNKSLLNLNVDFVANPDLLSDPKYASLALVQYFIDRFHSIPAHIVATETHTGDINGFSNINDALFGIYHANAGWSTNVFPDVTGGFAKAKGRVQEFYDFINAPTA